MTYRPVPWYRDWYWREHNAQRRRERRAVSSTEVVHWTEREPAPIHLTRQDLELIRRQVVVPRNARPPSDVELDDWGRACMARRLDPFDRQIYLAFLNGRWTWFIGVHGRLTIALRTGQVEGMEGPFFCAKREGLERAQPPDWQELWDGPGPPHAAKFVVYRKGWTRHPVGIAPWSYYGDGKTSPAWVDKPALMLGYKAITRALNLVFPDVMPAEPERDVVDVDESVGYVREHVAQTSTGPTEEDPGVTSPSARSAPMEFVLPTPEQVERVRQLRAQVGLDAPDLRPSWLLYVTGIVGRDVADTRELSRAEVAALIVGLEEEVGGKP